MTHAVLKDLVKKWRNRGGRLRKGYRQCADELSAALSAMEGEAAVEILGWNDNASPRLRFLTKVDRLTAGTILYTALPPQQAVVPQCKHANTVLGTDGVRFCNVCGAPVPVNPTPSPGPQGGGEAQVLRLTARQARVAQFALRRFANDARLGADDAAQKAGADKYPKGAAARFLQDADDAEAILAALATPPAYQPGEVVTDEMVARVAAALADELHDYYYWKDMDAYEREPWLTQSRMILTAALAPKEAGHG